MLAGQILTAELLNMNPTTYVPTLTAATTSPTLGTGGTVAGWYYRIGRLVMGEARIRFGSSGVAAGTGTYIISLPTAADGTFHATGGGTGIASVVGNGVLRDNSAVAASRDCAAYFATSTSVFLATADGNVTDANPWVWAASDGISVAFSYIIVEP